MAGVLDNALWYRVAKLKPALQSHVDISQQNLRGKTWYVLHDQKTGRQQRFSPAANLIIGKLDGEHTLQEIWDDLEEQHADLNIAQDRIIQLIIQLNAADLLVVPNLGNITDMLERGQERTAKATRSRYLNPLAMRFPLYDPDNLLRKTLPAVSGLLSRWGLLVWLVVVAGALLLAGIHWAELTENVSDRVLTPRNLMLIWFVYPCIKALHELGHGYITRRFGGEVHEMGIMLLVLMPVPYVDASASAKFPAARQRMLVAAAGILVELFVAALAMFVWVLAEPGLVRAIAFNAMLIGAISTVIVNGNPLLKFDGYYVLSDALQIPNLATRSVKQAGFIFKHHVLGLNSVVPPTSDSAEGRWLLAYAVLSFCYRMIIMYTIVLFIAEKFFVVGTLLAIYAVSMQLIRPAVRNLLGLLKSVEFRDQYSTGMRRGSLLALSLLLFFTALPIPLTTTVEGVVWLPPESEVRARTDAFIERLIATPGSRVQKGALLMELNDPEIIAQQKILQAELTEATARYTAVRDTDPTEAQILREEITRLSADLQIARSRVDALQVRSERAGEFIVNNPEDMTGRFARNGELLGFVAENSGNTVVVAVSQNEIGLIRAQRGDVELRLAEKLDQVIPAVVVRETPAASNALPSAALGGKGGGRFATNPGDSSGLETLDDVFQLELSTAAPLQRFGERAYVRFEHGYEPLAFQWYRNLRQVFLSRLDI